MASIAPPNHTRSDASSDSRITPKALIDQLGPFDLDPCECIPQPWNCAREAYTQEDNGLRQPWHGLVWLNPPYGRQTGEWLAKLAGHGNGIALVFARTETAMFFDAVWPSAHSLLFLRGRLHFHYPTGVRARANAGGPSVLIAYGDVAANRLRLNRNLGAVCELRT